MYGLLLVFILLQQPNMFKSAYSNLDSTATTGVSSSITTTASPTQTPVTVFQDIPFAYNRIIPKFATLQLPPKSTGTCQENSLAYSIDPLQNSRDQCISILQSLHTQDGLPPPALVGSFMEPSEDLNTIRQVAWSDSRFLVQGEFSWEAKYMAISDWVPMEGCHPISSPVPSHSEAHFRAPEPSQADLHAESPRQRV
jgi:hypothetical protein